MDERLIRQRARENLANNWGLSIGVAAIACLLGGLMTGSSFLPDIEYAISHRNLSFAQLGEEIVKLTVDSSGIFGLAAFIIGGVLQLGYARFLLKQHDRQPLEFNELFSQFDRFGAGFAQSFLRGLYIALWSLLFIIPGIIAGYSYALTPFLMVEHPELSANEAISLSKKMMQGNKGNLFVLDLSFIGWNILAILTLNIGFLAVNPYRNAAYAAFYREVCTRYQYIPKDFTNR